MVTIQEMYKKTNNGWDIIKHYYPKAEQNKKFFIRNERTPSASAQLKNGIWYITDFGDEGKALSPFDIIKKEENCDNKAAYRIMFKFSGLNNDGYISEANKAVIEIVPATEKEEEGHFEFEMNEHFSSYELGVLGPKVSEDVCKKYNFFSVKEYRRTKNRKTVIHRSTDTYPIFMRICEGHKKIYEPLNYDKAFRFQYVGKKPSNFINGLAELKKAHASYISHLSDNDKQNEKNNEKKDSTKLAEAIICSGERDALNVASFGYFPIWFNSESANSSFTEKDFAEISKYVEKIYNIPDIDNTGIREGRKLALRFLDMYTVELPQSIQSCRDNRGNPLKDLRDYVGLYPDKYNFEQLLYTAPTCKFWENSTKKGEIKLDIHTTNFVFFLKQLGFGKIKNPDTKESIFFKASGYKVERVIPEEIKDFVVKFLKRRMYDGTVLNVVRNSIRNNMSVINELDMVDLNFTKHAIDLQYLFFNNKAVKITSNGIEELDGKSCNIFVWDTDVNPHNFRRLEPSFEFDLQKGCEDTSVHFSIKHTKSHFFRYLINSSRMYWKEELQDYENIPKKDNEEYAAAHKFDIAGYRLPDYAKEEQLQHLINKIYTIGYLLHGYKDMARSVAVWIMENKLLEGEEKRSGGAGKSFMMKFLSEIKRVATIPASSRNFIEDKFFLDSVNEYTDIVNLDDIYKKYDLSQLFTSITGDMMIRRMGVKALVIKFKDAPKFVFSSNFAPTDVDGATMRRLLFCVFSDYYHKKTDFNNYLETKQISDDFGYTLHNENYSEEYWNEDFNFIVDCLHFYLHCFKNNHICETPESNVKKRMLFEKITPSLYDWMLTTFNTETSNYLNKYIERAYLFEEFKRETKLTGITPTKFKEDINLFFQYHSKKYTFNPKELCGTGENRNKITKRVGEQSKEFFYIQTADCTETKEYNLENRITGN
jgi:hypothetical protein